MSKKKKILIAVAACLGVALVAGLVSVFGLLSRVHYVSVDEAATIAEQQQEQYQQAVEAGEVEEEPAVLQMGELNLFEEVEQTELSADEIAALEVEQKLGDVTNILLIGVDRRGEKEMSRSDTIMIATLDKKNGRLKLTSLMRDLYVPIAGRGENRINSAVVRGGPGMLMETINENFQLDLEKYVLVDFRMFETIVDRLGGITIEMTKSEVSEANDCIAGLNKQWKQPLRDGFIKQRGGVIDLTGKQALGYARMRHISGGDFSRTSRQYKVLLTIYEKFFAADLATQTQLLYDLLPMVETNLETPEILAIASAAIGIENRSILHYRLPVEGEYRQRMVRGMWVLLPDIAANARKLHWFLYDAAEVDPLEGSDTGTGGKLAPSTKSSQVPAETPPPGTIPPHASPSPDGAVIPSQPVGTPSASFETASLTEIAPQNVGVYSESSEIPVE